MTDVPSALADPSYCVTLYYFGCVFLGMLVIAGILFRACISICFPLRVDQSGAQITKEEIIKVVSLSIQFS